MPPDPPRGSRLQSAIVSLRPHVRTLTEKPRYAPGTTLLLDQLLPQTQFIKQNRALIDLSNKKLH